VGLLSSGEDISAEHAAAQRLKESEERFHIIFESVVLNETESQLVLSSQVLASTFAGGAGAGNKPPQSPFDKGD
jgi:hypothetical protein